MRRDETRCSIIPGECGLLSWEAQDSCYSAIPCFSDAKPASGSGERARTLLLDHDHRGPLSGSDGPTVDNSGGRDYVTVLAVPPD